MLRVIVSPDAVTEPHGLARLRRYLTERYAATMRIQYTGLPGMAPLVLKDGAWAEEAEAGAANALSRYISEAFLGGLGLHG